MVLTPKGPKKDNLNTMLRKFFIKKYGLPPARPKATLCPDAMTLSEYVSQSLSPLEMKSTKMHLASCKECRVAVESVSDIVRQFESGDLEEVPDNVTFDVASHLKNRQNQAPRNSSQK